MWDYQLALLHTFSCRAHIKQEFSIYEGSLTYYTIRIFYMYVSHELPNLLFAVICKVQRVSFGQSLYNLINLEDFERSSSQVFDGLEV